MSSVKDFLKPELSNFKYKPVRIYKKKFTEDKTLGTTNIFVFVGSDLPANVKKILNGLVDRKYNISESDSKVLKNHFGKDWKSELALTKTQGGGGLTNNDDEDDDDDDDDDDFDGLDDDDEDYDNDRDFDDDYDDDDDNDESRASKQARLSISDDIKLSISDSFDESDEDISDSLGHLNLEEDIDSFDMSNDDQVSKKNIDESLDPSINDIGILFNEKNKLKDNVMFDKKAHKHDTKINPIEYVFDFILKVHSTSDIQFKLYKFFGIRPEFQNLTYINNDSITKNLVYNIEYVSNRVSYYVNLMNLYENEVSEKIGIPIDEYFQKKYGFKKIIIHDLRPVLLVDFENIGRDIYLFSLVDFLDLLDFRSYNENTLRSIHTGFVLKYFPQVSYQLMTKYNKTPDKELNSAKNYIGDIISEVVIENNKLTLNDFGDINPTKIILNTSIVKSALVSKSISERIPVLDFKLLINLFECSYEIPFIRYIDVSGKHRNMTYYAEMEKLHPTLLYHWKKEKKKRENITGNIVFKIFKYPKGHPKYGSADLEKSDYSTLELTIMADTIIRSSWNYGDNATFEMSYDSIIQILTYLTDHINRVDTSALIRYKTIPFPNEIEYTYFRIMFDLENLHINSFSHFENFILSEYSAFFKQNPDSPTKSDFLSVFYIRNTPKNIYSLVDQPVNKFLTNSSMQYNVKQFHIDIENNINPRIKISGNVKIYKNFVIIYNLILRIFVHYVTNVQTKITKNIVQKSTTKRKITSSRLRRLQIRDDVLFNFRSNTGENPYSRICQHKKQPIVYTKDEFKNHIDFIKNPKTKAEYTEILNRNKTSENILVYDNKTKPGEYLYYTCDDDVYKYPGFQVGIDKHPLNYCLPCCKKLPSIVSDWENMRINNNMKQYMECTRQNISDSSHRNDGLDENMLSDINMSPGSDNYIKQYGKDLGVGRFSQLPDPLNTMFGVKHTGNYINIKANIILLYGISQTKWSLLTATLTALGISSIDTGAEHLENMFKMLAKKPLEYETLSNGLVKQSYPTPVDFMEYLTSVEYIDEYMFIDFIRRFNHIEPGINIIVFSDENHDIKIDLVDRDIQNILEHKKTIILLRRENRYYYPLIHIYDSMINSIFTDSSYIIQKIRDLISRTNAKSRNLTDDNDFETPQSKNNIMNMSIKNFVHEDTNYFTFDDVIERCGAQYDIVGQIMNMRNLLGQIVVRFSTKKKSHILFRIPVQISTLSKDLDIYNDSDVNLPTFTQLNDFLESSDFNIKIKRIVVSKSQKTSKNSSKSTKMIVGIISSIGILFPVEPIPEESFKTVVPKKYWNIQVFDRSYNLIDNNKINSLIFQKSKPSAFNVPAIHDYQYTTEIYELYKLEISNYLAEQINVDLRKKINSILQNPKTIIRDIIQLHTKYESISANDNEQFRVIFGKHIKYRKLSDIQIYDFDGIVRHKLLNLITDLDSIDNTARERSIEGIKKILVEISNKTLHIQNAVPKDKSFVENAIRSICGKSTTKWKCENSTQCVWTDKKCKLIMSKNDYVYYLDLLINDFIYNEYIRESILYGTISLLKSDVRHRNSEDDKCKTIITHF